MSGSQTFGVATPPLQGNEVVQSVDPPIRMTTAQIAALAINNGTITVTPGTAPLVINGNTGTPPAFANGTLLEIIGATGTGANVVVDSFAALPSFIGRRADGTPAAPSAVQANEGLVTLAGRGYGTTGYNATIGGDYAIIAAENWTDSAGGTYHRWRVAASGGTTVAEAMRLQNSGILTIGATAVSGSSKLQVTGGTSTDTLAVSGATLSLTAIPTADPHVVGRVWANSGVLTISAG